MKASRCRSIRRKSIALAARQGAGDNRRFGLVWWTGILFALGVAICATSRAKADEGGVSMWVPGFFGSLAATPATPGFAFANILYHSSISAGADVAFARQVSRGNITANFTGNLNLSI